jgi:predicted DNA-binding protein with PD1-like motif
MTVSTASARHLLLRLSSPAKLPDSLLGALRDEVVLAGWLRASGVLSDVSVRVVDPRGTTAAAPRKIAGPVQVIALEGSVGLSGGDVSCGMRIVLARETDSGLETIAGDLVGGNVEALEVLITAFDDVTATRQLDRSGVWVLDATEGAPRQPPVTPPSFNSAVTAPAPASAPAVVVPSVAHSGFAEVSRVAVTEAPRPAPVVSPAPPPAVATLPSPARPSPTFSSMNNAMPQRIARPVQPETEDELVPEPGDIVEHFAFGRCDVVKTDGDRLHVRLGKDQRIKEIALEMLKVSPLPALEGMTTRYFKLARKL